MIPPPRTRLADCIWLPRILAKARLFNAGALPPEFAARFGVANGCDEQFLTYFGLTKEQILEVAREDDAAVVGWFTGLPVASPARIAEWNHIAENMGRPGFPLEARFPVGLSTTYAHLADRRPTSIFEMLEMDEGLL